jgi:gliding motility-associated-like protein
VLRPGYVGIKTLGYFTVFNRWGQKVFETKNLAEGWDGKIKGVEQPTGTYAWIIQAEDYVGKKYQVKGTSTIIK